MGYIHESMSLCAIPTLLVPKKDGSWHMHVDSKVPIRITVKHQFPIPYPNDMLQQLLGFKHFFEISLQNEYHQVKIHPRDEWKMVFKMVIPFGLSNTPSTLLRFIH